MKEKPLISPHSSLPTNSFYIMQVSTVIQGTFKGLNQGKCTFVLEDISSFFQKVLFHTDWWGLFKNKKVQFPWFNPLRTFTKKTSQTYLNGYACMWICSKIINQQVFEKVLEPSAFSLLKAYLRIRYFQLQVDVLFPLHNVCCVRSSRYEDERGIKSV